LLDSLLQERNGWRDVGSDCLLIVDTAANSPQSYQDGVWSLQLLLHLQIYHHWGHGRGEKLFTPPIYGEKIYGGLSPHDWGGVRN